MTAAAARPRVSLIENFANGAAGHWGDNLVRLCNGATAAGYEPIAVAVHGLHPQVGHSLSETGALIVDRPVGLLARASLRASRFLRPMHGLTYRIAPKSDLPARVRYASRCLAEVAALRTATRVAGEGLEATVILTASQGLAATAAGLSRTPHLRFVHYKGVPEGACLGALEKIFARSGRDIAVIATNATIESTTKQRHPDRLTVVRSFSVADPSMHIGEDERRPAPSRARYSRHRACDGNGWRMVALQGHGDGETGPRAPHATANAGRLRYPGQTFGAGTGLGPRRRESGESGRVGHREGTPPNLRGQ